MKRIQKFLFTALSLLGLCACNTSGGDTEYKVTPSSLKFRSEGGTQTIGVQSSAEVTAVSNVSWCEVTQVESQTAGMSRFSVTVPVNESSEKRSASVTITVAGTYTEAVPVEQEGNNLYIENKTVALDYKAQEFSISFSSIESCKINVTVPWIRLISEDDGQAVFSIGQNIMPYSRETRIVFSNSKAESEVLVTQSEFAGEVPAPDMSGMESDAKTLMKKMHLGLNLGNTLEATGGETSWGAPKTTEAMIKYFKELGFNAVRVPCSWDQHLESEDGYVIKSSWMNRVKEVIDYIIGNDMYAILNVHWDGGWLENDIPNGYDKAVDEQQYAIWTQIATTFRDYDEHLLFAGTNEPNVENASHMNTLLRYEQTFIDAVRATGGKNAYRVLVFQGPSTDIDKTDALMNKLPADEVENRLAAEVHYYTPWQFCGLDKDESWGKMMFFWGDDQKAYATGAYEGRWHSDYNEAYVRKQMEKMKKKFWDNGIPVIIGEYSVCTSKNCNLGTKEENDRAYEGYMKSRAAFNGCVVSEAKANGCVPFYWHCQGDLIDRTNLTVTEQATYEAIVKAGETQYPED